MTRNKYQDSLDKRFSSDNHHMISNPNGIIPYFEKLDPTKKKAFVLLFIRWYLDGSMRYLEDAPKAVPAIKEVMKYRNTLTDWKNLSFGDFLDLGDSLSKQVSQSEGNKAEEQKFYEDGEAQVFVDDADVKIIIPKTEAASCYFGKGTRWCTAADNDNMFTGYHRQGDLYIIIFRKDGSHWKKGDKWQFHFKTGQFMDAGDERLPDSWIKPLMQKYFMNIVNQNLSKNGLLIKFIKNPSEKVQLAAVQQNSSAIEYIKNPSEQVQLAAVKNDGFVLQYIRNPSEAVQLAAVQRDYNTIRFIKNPSDEIQLAAVSKHQYAIDCIKNPSEEVQLIAIRRNPNAIYSIKHPTPKAKTLSKQLWDR